MILVGDRRQHRSVTAGEPLKLLEEKAGLPVAEVTEILRQEGDYKKAAEALSEGRIEEAFKELDKLGWIKEVADSDRYKQLADAYLAAASGKEAEREGQVRPCGEPDARRRWPNHRFDPRRPEGEGQARQGTHCERMGSGSPDRCPESGRHRI